MDTSLSSSSIAGGDPKTILMNQVRQEAAISNARQLVEKINEHCFDRCVPKPGSSLSRGEEGCFSACMEKYMAAWNVVSKSYVARIQRDQAVIGSFGGSTSL